MKKAIRKRIMSAVLLGAMAVTTLLGQTGTLETKAAVAHFDGNDYRMSGQVDEGFYDDDSSSVMGYTKGNPREGYTAIRKGIDATRRISRAHLPQDFVWACISGQKQLQRQKQEKKLTM